MMYNIETAISNHQLVSPVLWKKCLGFMIDKGVDYFVEIEPSKVLKGLIRKINSEVRVVNIEKSDHITKIGERYGV